MLDTSHTTTIVELDQLFDTFDAKTRQSLKEFIQGFGTEFKGVAGQANTGFQYLDPSISTSSAVFRELNSDTPMLAGFLEDSARFADAVATRGDEPEAAHWSLHEIDVGTNHVAAVAVVPRADPVMGEIGVACVVVRAGRPAPTLLALMQLPQPAEMTGKSLVRKA